MKIFFEQSPIIFGRLFVLLLLALCLFDFGVQAVAADNSVQTSAYVIESTGVEIAPNYNLQVVGDTDVDPVDGDSFDLIDIIKWIFKKFPWFEPEKSGYGWSD